MNKDKILGHLGIEKLHLANGAHASRDAGVCLMEAVAWFAGEEHSDRPSCTSPVLAAYARIINDSLSQSERQLLVPLIPRLVGTVDPALDVRRCQLLADRAREFARCAWYAAADAARYANHAAAHAAESAEYAKYAASTDAAHAAGYTADAAAYAKSAAWSAAAAWSDDAAAAATAGYTGGAAAYAEASATCAAGAAARSAIVESAIEALSDAIEVV